MKNKKQLAGKIMSISPNKVKFAFDALEDIKKAITRADLRGLIAIGKISKRGTNEQSRVRARKIAVQKRKGRRSGAGSKKGKKHSIVTKKEKWISKVRIQRVFLKELRERKLITVKDYRDLYRKSKGGYFRNKRHIKLYLTEHKLIQTKENGKK